jgi:hypothetical protein
MHGQDIYLRDHIYTWQNFAMPYGSFNQKEQDLPIFPPLGKNKTFETKKQIS